MRQTILFMAIMLVFAGSEPQAQVTYLEGRVVGADGGSTKDANIKIEGLTVEFLVTDPANDQGFFRHAVPLGQYKVTIKKRGYHDVIVEPIETHAAVPKRIAVEMTPETQPAPPMPLAPKDVEPLAGEESQFTYPDQILDLPLNGRNPLELALLQAGVVTNDRVDQASIDGLRSAYSNISQDGTTIQNAFQRNQGLFAVTAPSVENVLEFRINTHNSRASDGMGAPQIRLVTRSGGKELHGSAFYFHRNRNFNANSFFNNAADLDRAFLLRHQFGGRVGGALRDKERPAGEAGDSNGNWSKLVPEKVYFFGYFEATREAQETRLLRTTLTDSVLAGLGQRRIPFRYQGAQSRTLETVNLLDFRPLGLDPTVMAILERLPPSPNDLLIGDGANSEIFGDQGANIAGFRFNSSRPRQNTLWGFRFDFVYPQHSLEATFSQVDLNLPRGFQNVGSSEDIGEVFPESTGGGHESVRRVGSLAWHYSRNHVFFNELRWGVQRPTFRTFNNEEVSQDDTQLEMPLIDNPVQNLLGTRRKDLVYEVADHADWIKGRHLLRFGGELRLLETDSVDDSGLLPIVGLGFASAMDNPLREEQAIFPGGISPADRQRASDLLALLTGVVRSSRQTLNFASLDSGTGFIPGLGKHRILQQKFLGLYVSDRILMGRDLTFNLGLRWDWQSVPAEINGMSLLPQGGLESLQNPLADVSFAGPGTSRPFFSDDWNNFSPRLGLAWNPFGKNRMVVRAGYSLSYVIDNSLPSVLRALDSNPGLSVTPRTAFNSGLVTLQSLQDDHSAPALLFEVPRTAQDQLGLDLSNGLFTIDPNLRTPYVQQWKLSFERQFRRDYLLRLSYVGNRGSKLFRSIDSTQWDYESNGFLEDFRRAQLNLERTGSPLIGIPLQIFPLLADRGRTLLSDATVQQLLRNGEIGELLFFMFVNQDSLFSQDGGAQIGTNFFFGPNHNALFTNFLGNGSFSSYHAFQAEFKRRFARKLFFQFNYSFSKALTDFAGSPDNLMPLVDANNPALDRRRANFDVRHAFTGSFIVDLPKLPGWRASGILNWRSGAPLSIVSQRGTFARRANSLSNTVLTDLSGTEIQGLTSVFRSGGPPRLFDAGLIDFLRNPGVGQLGTLGLTPVEGPGFFSFNLGLIKRFKLRGESQEIEVRAEAFNLFNNINWRLERNEFGDAVQNINDLSFGRLLDTFEPRIIQLAFKFNF